MTKSNGHTPAPTTGDPELDDLLDRTYARWLELRGQGWAVDMFPFHPGSVPGMPAGSIGSIRLSIQPTDPRRWEPPVELWTEERV